MFIPDPSILEPISWEDAYALFPSVVYPTRGLNWGEETILGLDPSCTLIFYVSKITAWYWDPSESMWYICDLEYDYT